MAWTTPPTFVAATTATAADMNLIRDDLNYLKGISDGVVFSGVQLTRSTNQTLTTGVGANITWLVEALDYGSWWSTGTTVTVPAGAIPAGYTSIAVMIFGRIRFAANSTGSRRIRVLQNGTSIGSRTSSALGGGDTTDTDISDVAVCASGDTFTLEGYQTSGGNLAAELCAFTVVRFAPVV
jgi:hypothetical protein